MNSPRSMTHVRNEAGTFRLPGGLSHAELRLTLFSNANSLGTYSLRTNRYFKEIYQLNSKYVVYVSLSLKLISGAYPPTHLLIEAAFLTGRCAFYPYHLSPM